VLVVVVFSFELMQVDFETVEEHLCPVVDLPALDRSSLNDTRVNWTSNLGGV